MNNIVLIRITDTDNPMWKEAMDIYDVSFPAEEKRSHQKHVQLIQENNAYHFYAATENRTVVGMLVLWELQGFVYLDYLATSPHFRNKGFGKQIIERLKALFALPMVLEVELPKTDLAKRRTAFYMRLGFHLSDFPYYMPDYTCPQKKIHMYLMSFPAPIDHAVGVHAMREIHAHAYNTV
ncbi:MAG: GNAT family N-acetyltransferase [Bacteroidales bacterium]|jgi:ribosomal protein S18 acetylase RimI-like enzyme|nr:GNAT family N-acetyltransferase [Bacteroidales bacterium]